MLPRLAPLARTVLKNTQPNVRRYGGEWRHPREIALTTRTTIGDIPVPQGSWKENFDKRNSGWNMWFALGLVTMSATIALTFQFGVWELHSAPDLKKIKPNLD